MFIGPIPGGLLVCHKCDNKACVNPSHFFLGDEAANALDMVIKGRAGTARGERHGKSPLVEKDVLAIRALRGVKTTIALGRRFGIGSDCVSRIQTGKHWRHVLHLTITREEAEAVFGEASP